MFVENKYIGIAIVNIFKVNLRFLCKWTLMNIFYSIYPDVVPAFAIGNILCSGLKIQPV